MKYIDPYNYPELAVRDYIISNSVITPNLFNGTIFRVEAGESFTLDRIKNQIDGAKVFLEFYNTSVSPITVTFNEDYRSTNLGTIDPAVIGAGETITYELICRIGLLFICDVEGTLPTEEEDDTIEWDDGISYFRLQVRGGYLYLDQTMSATGFSGIEGNDWDFIWRKTLPDAPAGVGVAVFDGVDDYISLSSDLGIDIEDNKTITFDAYLDSNVDNGPFCMFAFKSTEIQDYLAVVWEPGLHRMELRYSSGPGSSKYYDVTAYEDQSISCEVIKEGSGIDAIIISFKIDGNTLIPSTGSSASPPASSNIGFYDSSFLSKYFSIWDILIKETGGADLHSWDGYPGDEDSGWVDGVGSLDGTVNGSPTTRVI